jgi:anti-sigma B factor antagonist
MKTETWMINEVTVLEPHGRLMGGQGTEDLDQKLSALLGKGTKSVVLDLSNTDWINSAGLGVLIHHWKAFRDAGAELRLANLTRKALDVLVISRLASLFRCYETTDEAVASFA